MTYVVTEKCIGCRHGDCVEVCPTDSFHMGPNMLAINPSACIDCGACVPACPEQAIFSSSKTPDKRFIALNAKLVTQWPKIDAKPEGPLPGHEAMKSITDVKERLSKLILK